MKKLFVTLFIILLLPAAIQACGGYGIGAAAYSYGYAVYVPPVVTYVAPPVVQTFAVQTYAAPVAYAAPVSYVSSYPVTLVGPTQAYSGVVYGHGGYNVGNAFLGRSYSTGAAFHNIGSNAFVQSNAYVQSNSGKQVFNTGGYVR